MLRPKTDNYAEQNGGNNGDTAVYLDGDGIKWKTVES